MRKELKKTRRLKLEKTLPATFSFEEDRESVLRFLNEAFHHYKTLKNHIQEKRYNYD